MMKKLLSLILTAALAGAALCGCAPKTENSSAPGAEKTTISVLSYMGEGSKRTAFKALADAYTAQHPEVEFSIQDLDMGSFMNMLQTRISGGEAPDLIMGTAIGNRHLIEAGQLLDLTEEDFIRAMDPKDLASGTVEEKVYSLPVDWCIMGTFYNKDLFAQYGLSVPKTYTEFMDIIHTFEAAGIVPFTRPYKDANNVTCDFCTQWYPLLECTKNYSYFMDIQSGEKKFSDFPESRQAFDQFKERLDCASDDDIGTDASVSLQLFASGKYPMHINGSWAVGDIIANNPDGNFGVFATPISDDERENLLYQATDDSWMVSSQTKHKEEVLDFMRFMTSQEGVDLWAQQAVALTYIPASSDGMLPPVMQDIVAIAKADRTMNADKFLYFTGEAYDKFNMDCQLFAAMDDRDVDKILEQLDNDLTNLS